MQLLKPIKSSVTQLLRSLCTVTCLILLALVIGAMPCRAQHSSVGSVPSSLQTARTDPYTPHLPARAYAYFRANRILFFAGTAWHLLGFALFLRLGLSARCRDLAETLARRRRKRAVVGHCDNALPRAPAIDAVGVFYIAYSSLFLVWQLPVGLAGFAIEHRFGFSTAPLSLFLKDELTRLCFGWYMVPIVWVGYRIYSRWQKKWWLVFWALIVPVHLFITIVYPVTISPLYNRYTPLEAGSLRDDLLALAARAGIHHSRIFVEDTSRRTSHVNAYVTGIGPSTRIVLNDTALKELPHDQIIAMMGHEMGHYVERHVLIGAAAAAIGTGFILGFLAVLLPWLVERCGKAFRLRGLNDLAALPLLFLVIYVVGLIGTPVSSAISRVMEHRADTYGLRVTGLNDATARLMVGFAERDLSNPNPPPLLHYWFGTHPTLKERIDFALRFHLTPRSPFLLRSLRSQGRERKE